jgi:branched-chain amino acid transport system ATP-binding protein
MTLIEANDLDAGYEDLQVLFGVDVHVDEGEYVTLVGPNGAGKSTLMKSIFGLTTHMGGTVVFDGRDITHEPPERIISLGLTYVFQNETMFPSLTVRENLAMGGYILDETPEDRIDRIFDRFPDLRDRGDLKARALSGGQQKMLALGRALMLEPDLLLLDEPSAGLAPSYVEDMFDRIDDINDDGTAILMVEQNAREALGRCDRGYVLVQGENRYEDTGESLLNDEQVRREFLGG